ncbi:MAG: hypothetical protein R3D98_12310 [Candidatus Krumholzibacteriia bacterium]
MTTGHLQTPGQLRRPAEDAGLPAQERQEEPARAGVLVAQKTHHTAFAHGPHEILERRPDADDADARPGSQLVLQPVDPRVGLRLDQEPDRTAEGGGPRAEQLPVAEVGRHQDGAALLLPQGREVLGAVDVHERADPLGAEAPVAAELEQRRAELCVERAAEGHDLLRLALVAEGGREVVQDHPAAERHPPPAEQAQAASGPLQRPERPGAGERVHRGQEQPVAPLDDGLADAAQARLPERARPCVADRGGWFRRARF